jgi:hypothetical protein
MNGARSPQPSLLPAFRVFISCVSDEFRAYRRDLQNSLTASGREIKIQEQFTDSGGKLLEQIDNYISKCQAVIHLVGDGCGVSPTPVEVRTMLKAHPQLVDDLGVLPTSFDTDLFRISYTQWEAFLAMFYRVPCFVYLADSKSRREDWKPPPDQIAAQKKHVERLEAMGHKRRMLPFVDAKDVALGFLNAILQHGDWSADEMPEAPQTFVWPQAQVHLDSHLADRHEEFQAFIRLVTGQSTERIQFISAPSDRGKSVLLAQFVNFARRMPGLCCGHADFKASPSLADVLWDLSRDLAPLRFPRFKREMDRSATDSLRTAFLQDLDESGKPVVLVLDTYEQATEEASRWVENRLLPHVRRYDGLRLVLAGIKVPALDPSRPWSRIATSRELPLIKDPAHWCDYARRVMGLTVSGDDQMKFDDHIRIIVRAAAGHPRLLETLVANLVSDGG